MGMDRSRCVRARIVGGNGRRAGLLRAKLRWILFRRQRRRRFLQRGRHSSTQSDRGDLPPYAIAGVGGAEIHRNYPDFHSNDAGLSYGAGLEFNLGAGASVNVEWARLISNGDNVGYEFTADQLTFGVNWHPYFF
jgi:hypothetical protein